MLKCRDLSYQVSGRTLISTASLAFEPSCIYGVIGPNGAGKSTLLRLLAGLIHPTSGVVSWKNRDLQALPPKELARTLSLVTQGSAPAFDFSVKDFLLMGLYPLGLDQDTQVIEEAAAIVEVSHLLNRSIATLSSGERQRVQIARTIAMKGPVILLDEATANLDIRHQIELESLLMTLKRQGKTIITVMHDIHRCSLFCDRLVLVDQGEIVAETDRLASIESSIFESVFGVELQKAL